ncbi:TetR/AcrR family transcriptional regulator [Sphingomonas sp. So64.6b]|uniref:TetR/AcrR family transcriptional regulator n=1 Tax=Sphingomonas sp. So64.6b TaxID=2997354 RepID=UPI001604399A|nr:TetR/AcrR family transcriptional regulator [Sphingomonas sp. So64.6b]QNA86278.1 TetR/AcrR family transcriptional regulator [Sphingomonas sp. So64.6b]
MRRTRTAIVGAFTRLLFTRRYETIRTAQLIAEADIGRSTFYEHFRSKDDVLVAVIDPIFEPLADAAAGRGNMARLRLMLDHMWQQRALGRVIFDPGRLPRLQRKLAAMIDERLDGGILDGGISAHVPHALIATAAAAGQLAMLRMWLAGEVACPVATLAQHLMNDFLVVIPRSASLMPVT